MQWSNLGGHKLSPFLFCKGWDINSPYIVAQKRGGKRPPKVVALTYVI